MSIKPADIQKGPIGPNASGEYWRTSGLITTGVAINNTLQTGVVYSFRSIKDAEALGLNKAYDTTNNVSVWHEVSEFFRLAPSGTKLYFMLVEQSVLMPELVEDTAGIYCKKLLAAAKGEIFTLGVAFNPDAAYTESPVDGLNADVRDSIVKAQALAQWAYDSYRPCQVFIGARAYAGPAASVLDLRAIAATPSGIFEGTKVTLVIGQDYNYAATLTGHAQKYAAVGAALGMRAACQPNQNMGEVEIRNLTNELQGAFTSAGLSNHKTVEESEAELETLDLKGYVFPLTYTDISGYRWNDQHVCAPVIVDTDGTMNEHTVALGATLDVSVRRLRAVLTPKIKSVQPVDPATGKMPTGIIKYFEGLGNAELANLVAKGWISGGATKVNPDSDMLVAKRLEVFFEVVPYGEIGSIKGTINLKIKS